VDTQEYLNLTGFIANRLQINIGNKQELFG